MKNSHGHTHNCFQATIPESSVIAGEEVIICTALLGISATAKRSRISITRRATTRTLILISKENKKKGLHVFYESILQHPNLVNRRQNVQRLPFPCTWNQCGKYFLISSEDLLLDQIYGKSHYSAGPSACSLIRGIRLHRPQPTRVGLLICIVRTFEIIFQPVGPFHCSIFQPSSKIFSRRASRVSLYPTVIQLSTL